MSYFKGKNKEFSFRDLIYKALIFIGTVGVIVYFLPRDGKFNYQFDIDKPWKYGQLMATFDFPIYKDDQVVKREQDSILASFQPYFQLDKNTEKEVIKKLKNDYQTHLRDVLPSTDYIRHIEKILSEVYRAGILSTEELGQLHKDSTSAIMVINDKLASQRDIDKLYSVKQAYAFFSPPTPCITSRTYSGNAPSTNTCRPTSPTTSSEQRPQRKKSSTTTHGQTASS